MSKLITIGIVIVAILTFSAVAYAATVKGTHHHDWGKNDKIGGPPGCGKECGKIVRGTGKADTLYGYEGWDYISGLRGNDTMYGGKGMEIFQGHQGNDKMYGGPGHDHGFGGKGNDWANFADGKIEPGNVEQFSGDAGRDTVTMDEDPKDGVVIDSSTEKVIIKDIGLKGKTPVYTSREGRENGNIRFYLLPGTHTPRY